jgi:hypothetical protein
MGNGLWQFGRINPRLGPAPFFGVLVATCAWLGAGMWLSHKVGWPDPFGAQCHDRTCLLDELQHSPALLREGGLYPDALFAWQWSILWIPLAIIAWFLVRRRRPAEGPNPPVASTNSSSSSE